MVWTHGKVNSPENLKIENKLKKERIYSDSPFSLQGMMSAIHSHYKSKIQKIQFIHVEKIQKNVKCIRITKEHSNHKNGRN